MINDIAKEKRRLVWKRRLFIASFITVPLLHFLIFHVLRQRGYVRAVLSEIQQFGGEIRIR